MHGAVRCTVGYEDGWDGEEGRKRRLGLVIVMVELCLFLLIIVLMINLVDLN